MSCVVVKVGEDVPKNLRSSGRFFFYKIYGRSSGRFSSHKIYDRMVKCVKTQTNEKTFLPYQAKLIQKVTYFA